MRPPLVKTFLEGIHYLIPIIVLLYFLAVLRYTPKTSVLYAIVTLTVHHLRAGDRQIGVV